MKTWEDPRSSAQLWHSELGCNQREFESLHHGVWDPPDRYVTPFRKVPRRPPKFTEEEREFGDITIQERLDKGVWERISTEEGWQGRYVSMEFIVTNRDGKMRSVAGFRDLSRFWNRCPKKISTLESFAVMLQPKDHMLSIDLKCGYHQFRLHPNMRKYVVVRSGLGYFRYTALPFGWRHSDYYFLRLTSPA